MYKKIFKEITREFSEYRALNEVYKIYSSDKRGTFASFNNTAEYIYNKLNLLGLTDVKISYYKSDGKTFIADWMPSPAWNCYAAYLQIKKPVNKQKIIVSFPERLLCAAMNSSYTSKNGTECEVFHTNNIKEVCKAEGKILLTGLKISDIRKEIVRNGIVGVISYSVFSGCCKKLGLYDKNIIYWENTWFARKDETNFFAFKISYNHARELIKIIKSGEKLVVKAYVDSENYSGKVPIISGVIPGKNRKEEAVMVGHLFEVGANDNASGAGIMIETARTLHELIKRGKIKRPRRSIRFLLTFECYGTLSWLLAGKNAKKKFVAGLNPDMVGQNQKICGSVLNLHKAQEETASFVNELLIKMFNSMSGKYPAIKKQICPPTISDCVFLSDPAVNCPTPMLFQFPDRFYHSESDSMDKVDGKVIKFLGDLSVSYLYFAANAGIKEAFYIIKVICEFWDKEIGKEKNDEKKAYSLYKFSNNLNSVLNILKQKDKYEIRKKIRKLKSKFESKYGIIDFKFEENNEQKGSDLVPKRLKSGLLTLDTLSDKEKKQFINIAKEGFPWSSYLTSVLFWADGKRSVNEINWLLKNQYKKSDLQRLINIYAFLMKNGCIKFMKHRRHNER